MMVKGCICKYLLVTLFMLIIIFFLCGCDSSATPSAEKSAESHAIAGWVAGKAGLIYFINPADYNKIYSYDEQSGKYERISDVSSHSIIIDGDWIYYEGLFNNKLSRIRLDGTVHEEIKGLPIFNTDFFSYFVADGWIYYKWWDFDNNSGFFRLNTDGDILEAILENGDRVRNFFVADDLIYYTSEDDGSIYKIGTDGGDQVLVGDYDAREIMVYEGYIYFIKDNFELNRVSLDGGEAIKLGENEVYFYTIFDDWIYYTNRDDNFRLYKMRADGSESQMINDNSTYKVYIIDDWIYYRNSDHEGRLYLNRMKADGSQKQDLFIYVRPEEAYDASKPLIVSEYYMNLDTDWIVDGKTLNLGMYESDILQLLGMPVEITDKDCDDDYSEQCSYSLIYPGVVIALIHHMDKPDNARVINLTTDSPLAFGPRAIRVGDTFAQVLEKFPDDGNPVEEASDFQKDMFEYYHILYGSYSISGPICEIYYDEHKSPIEMSFVDGTGDTSASLYASYFTLYFKDGLVSSMEMGHSCWCVLN